MHSTTQIKKNPDYVGTLNSMELAKCVRKPIVKVGHSFKKKNEYSRKPKFGNQY